MLEPDVSSYRTRRPTARPLESFSLYKDRKVKDKSQTSTVHLAAKCTILCRFSNGNAVTNSARSAGLSAFNPRKDLAEDSLCHTLVMNFNSSKGNP